jgi:hypothetical protein
VQDGTIGVLFVSVSDGKVFNLTLSEPVPGQKRSETAPWARTVPRRYRAFPDTTITVVAVDRQGKPPRARHEIRFGLIDSPKVPDSADFAIRGPDGDPQESGTLFTAPTDSSPPPVAAPDLANTLVVFGKIGPGQPRPRVGAHHSRPSTARRR